MKKLFLLLIAAAAGYAVWRRVSGGKAERDLWSEVTDALD
ncbi:DLW-39 family protein [Xylanimonas sp. McL0601]